MKRSIQMTVLITACCFGALLAFNLNLSRAARATAPRAAAAPQGAPSPDADLAMNNPDQFNWTLFAQICQPAPTQSPVPGGNTTNNALWETWADDPYTFPAAPDPKFPPTWAGRNGGGKSLQRGFTKQLLRGQVLRRGRGTMMPRKQGVAAPQVETGGGEEVRRNQSSFDFIIGSGLWYQQGIAAAAASAAASGTSISFPTDAIEVKAAWVPISASQKANYHWNYDISGNLYGLVALHIMSKTVPNWTWATFEWVGNAGRCDYMGCHDSFGVTPADVSPNSTLGQTYPAGTLTPALLSVFTAAGLGPEWQNYRLKGSQTDFTDATGRYTLLGNSVLERGFVQYASCMTCHANASFNAQGAPQPSIGFITSGPLNGQSTFGAPNPAWFWTNTSGPPPPPTWAPATYTQVDFVWGMIKAASTASAPAPRAQPRNTPSIRPRPRRRP